MRDYLLSSGLHIFLSKSCRKAEIKRLDTCKLYNKLKSAEYGETHLSPNKSPESFQEDLGEDVVGYKQDTKGSR